MQCSNLKQDPTAHKKYLQKDRQRKKQKVANITPLVQSLTLSDSPTITPNQSPSTSTLPKPFSNRASLHRSVNKATLDLPKIPQKKTHVIHSLIQNLSPSSRGNLSKMMRWQPHKSSSTGQHIILSEEKKEFLLTFLKSEGISYTVPGRKDQVYIGKGPDGQRMYKPKYYLLWTLREILAMLNEELCNENSFKSKLKRH